jgi:ABC-type nitrate/sulfonate/bicarbonate transport system substrate-binding protein
VTQHEELRLGLFSPSIVSAIAQRRGLYASAGLAVAEHPVSSSPAQFASLRDGEYHLVLTAPDNVATYRFNAGNPLGERLDVRMVAGVDAGMGLSLVARGGIATVEELRGGKVAVDVPTSGFALVLYAMLERHGLRANEDVELVVAGSTPRRWAALAAGEFDATLLNAGFDVVAEAAGYRRLARVQDVAAPYLGTVLAATGPFLDEHPDTVTSFLTAWDQARRLALDPANADECTRVVAELFDLDGATATDVYRVATDPATGLLPHPAVPHAGLTTVLELRRRQGGFTPARELRELLDGDSGLVEHRFTAGLADTQADGMAEPSPAGTRPVA